MFIFKDMTNLLDSQVNFVNGNAESVTFIRHWVPLTIKAKKEIILSAGAYQTPQILMLSGIGDSAHLRAVGVNN